MKYNKTILGLFALTLILTAGVGMASAYQGDRQGDGQAFGQQGQRPINSNDMNAAVQEALDNNDYEAWLEAVGDRPMAEKIRQENFENLVEIRRLVQEGKFEEAKSLRDELGLPGGPGYGLGGYGRRSRNLEKGYKFVDGNGDGVCDRQDLQN